ncbi:hypothetical protein OHB05_41705 [Streptomyces sp. NBC_00638]|nr:hypothetical protein [Streptomyces sp. NBC_00638]MCX5009037.1 hypothetical protein [Streptomyces sp. NBC_00638]
MASGASGDGFTSRALPATSAGASFSAVSTTGAFQGVRAATGPYGRRRIVSLPCASSMRRSASRPGAASAYQRNTAAENAISPRQSASGLPDSRASSGASVSAAASRVSAAASSAAARSDTAVRAQSGAARPAAATARSTCLGVAGAAQPTVSAVLAGL